MNVKIIAIIVIFVNNFRFCQSAKYHNFSLFNIVPNEPDHLQFLQNLDHQKYINVIFWKKPYKLYESVQLLVDPVDKGLFLERVQHYKLNVKLLLNDTQRAFDNQIVQRYFKLSVETYEWIYYHTLDDIYYWLTGIAEKYAKLVQLSSIGKSAEGRDIFVLSTKSKHSKSRVIVEGGIHGNEWISVEFVTYLLDQMLKNARQTNILGQLLRKYEWHFIPIVNPDGYEYSHKTDRLWRKNRRHLGQSFGVDLNRNFNYNFARFGTSTNENDECYCGPYAFSEPESKALADFIALNKKGLKFYIAFHGYGQKIIIPYSDTIKHIENYADAEKFGKQAISKIYSINGVKYKLGTHYDTLGLRISGNSASYVKNTHNVRYVYTLLLRDNGTYGYALPREQILPTCIETLHGIINLMTTKHKSPRHSLLYNHGHQLRRQLISFMFVFTILIL